ncbi:hypothetical protein TURU_022824 [Turdus rufiventris]|nr:hypothetical protein TURU_022824 [Turdus rufiventris]
MGTPSPENQLCPGLPPKQHGQEVREGILTFCSALVRPHLEHCIQLWGPSTGRTGPAGVNVRRMKHLFFKGKLRQFDFFSLKKRRLWGEQIVAFQYLEGGLQGRLKGFYTRACSGRTRGNEFKLEESRSRSHIRQKFLTVRLVRFWNGLPREAVDAPSLEVFKIKLDGALNNLIQQKVSLSPAGML